MLSACRIERLLRVSCTDTLLPHSFMPQSLFASIAVNTALSCRERSTENGLVSYLIYYSKSDKLRISRAEDFNGHYETFMLYLYNFGIINDQ